MSRNEEFVEIKKVYKQLYSATKEELTIKVTITTSNKVFAEVFYTNDKIFTWIKKTSRKRGPPAGAKIILLDQDSPENQKMRERESTFLETSIFGGTSTTLNLWILKTGMVW